MSAGLATDDPWGDRQQGLAAGPLRRAAGRRPHLRMAARDRVRLLQPGLRDPGPRHHERRRRRVPRGRPGPPARAAGHDVVGLSRGGGPGGAPGPRVRRVAARSWSARGGTRTARSHRWAGCSPRCATSRAGSAGSWTRSRPARIPEGPHPLRRASRREMQQVQRAFGAEVRADAPDAEPVVLAGGYGFGLFVAHRPGPRHDRRATRAGTRASGPTWRGTRRPGWG